MANHPLRDAEFEWHDLPIAKLAIVESGLVLDLLPFNELSQQYDHACLSLLDPESMCFDMQGNLTRKDLKIGLEVTDFDFIESDQGRISGELGIIPNCGGYWTIRFTNAIWQFVGPK